MNRNDFDVPPVIDVPADVRDRIEARVLSNLTEETQRPRPKAWLAIAAAAAVFVAGGLVMWISRPSQEIGTAAAPTVDTMAEPTAIERCWQSAQHSPSAYPGRSAWQQVMAVVEPRSTVTAVLAGGKPMFCETTPFRVTLSPLDADPAYADGTKTVALLRTDSGTIAGVADPSWSKVMVEVKAKNGDGYSGETGINSGLFVMQTPLSKLESVSVRKDDNSPWLPLPAPPAPFTTVEPHYPPGDRATPLGKQLGECLDKAGEGAEETAGWSPGAMVEAGGERLFMTVIPGGVGACYQQQSQRATFMPYLTDTVADKPKLLPVAPTVGDLPLMAGEVPPGAVRMRVTFTDNSTKDIPVTASTFAAVIENKAIQPVHVVLYGEGDRELYRGSFN